MDEHIGVRRMKLSDICPGLENTLLVGIIIASQSAKTVSSKKDASLRGIWNFTLRDSEVDFVNVAVWGPPEYTDQCAEDFHIGDVVSVTNARITFRVTGGQEDMFRPDVSCPFQLTLSKNTSEMILHTLPDANDYLYLLHIPTKQSLDIASLKDITSNGDMMEGNFVNLLVAVQSVQRVRQIKSQNGRQCECREIVIFDRSSNGISLQLWDKEMIFQSSQWKPRETILFMADIRMKWNGFRQACLPSVTSKTIITMNPQTPEAECLRVYALAAPLQARDIIDHLASNIVDVGIIRNVLSVRAVLSRAWAEMDSTMSEDDKQFTALVYAVVTHMDLLHENSVEIKCSSCEKITGNESSCSNPECAVEQGTELFEPIKSLNLRISLSDHTGSIKNCRLIGETAEAVLGCSVSQFGKMTTDQKSSIQWNFLLKHCTVRIVVLKASKERRQPYISIVSCTVADLGEVASHLPMM